ncbi:fasciclin domain-containing protein [Sphingobacterium yanglingense]|uniref:Fasciclin domain-containing protein n=1 Tax=Sphingobacterium yanglingense TaxID=1437280 RepID=A0A4R6WEN9_9SPHI|nr:fasciclin domain-containing protein [Sphingobacterium yanglingense]TDQ73700.1 fasciclin domain-containing protein [Sphingobacterium yanglingense]
MKRFHIPYLTTIVLLTIGLCSSCLKKEFMPPPIGESIPYQDSIPTFYEAFSDPAYSTFLHAWRRSRISSQVNVQDPKTKFTVLIPDNQAMAQAGYTLAKINQMSLNDIDSLVFYHTIKGQMPQKGIEESKGNTRLNTLLTHPSEMEGGTSETGENSVFHYKYKVYFGIENQQILLNGKPHGPQNRIVESKQATLIPISKVLVRPSKTTAQFLREDGRFSMFIKALNYSDSLYHEMQTESNPYYYQPEGYQLRMNMLSTFNSTSLLVPTDDAFKKAGIYTVSDIEKLCERSPVQVKNWTGTMSNFSVIDSVMNNHWWQINSWNVLATDPRGLATYHQAKNAFTPFSTFFSNDLRNEILGTIVLSWEVDQGYRIDSNNLEFDRANNEIRIKTKGSKHPAAKVIEQDILTYTGVVHVIDRLLLPKDFKLN